MLALLNWRFSWRSLSGVDSSGSLALLGPLGLCFPCVYCVAALLCCFLEALHLGIVVERDISMGPQLHNLATSISDMALEWALRDLSWEERAV